MPGALPYDEDELRQRDAALRHLARRVSWIDADAEDVVQETWLKSLIAPPRDSRRLFAWLRIVVLHAAGKIHRSRRNERKRLRLRARSSEVPSALDDLERETSRARTLDWLYMLDEPYREVLRLRYLEDLSTAEIAARLERREGTVRVQLKRGLDMLRIRAGKDERRFPAWFASWWRMRMVHWRPALACSAVAILVVITVTLVSPTRPTAVSVSRAHASTPVAPLAAFAVDEARAPSEARTSARPTLVPVTTTRPSASIGSGIGSFVGGGCYTDLRQPVPKAEIWGAPHGRLDEGVLLGHADDEGLYRIRVPAEIHWLWADEVLRTADGAELQRSGSLRVRLAGSTDAAPVDLCFSEGFSMRLSGTVVDPSGAPVVGADVWTGDRWSDAPLLDRWQIHPHPSSATTDERGEFDLRLFRHAHQDICVAKQGFAPVSTRVLPSVSRVSIRLPLPAVLTGRLVDPDHGALPEAAVHLELAEPLPELRTRTDEAGRFRFDLVPPGSFCLRAFPNATGLSLVHSGQCVEGEAQGLGDLEAAASHSLSGHAFEAGKPVAGWQVVLQEESKSLGKAIGAQTRTSTGEDGSFEFKACQASSYRAWLLEPGVLAGPARTWRRDLQPGCAGVRLEAAPASARIHGRMEDSLRSSLQVGLEGALLPRPVRVELGPDGSFALSLPAGSYELTGVSKALGKWSFASLDLIPGETRVLDCRAPVTGSLSIRVHPAPGFDQALRTLQGRLIGTAYSTTFQAERIGSGAVVDVEQGTIRFPSLIPGEYVVLLYTGITAGMGAEYRSARVVGGLEAELEVHFEPGHRVKVQCRAERLLLDGEQFSCVIASKHGEARFPVSATLPGSLDAMLLFRKLLAAGTYALRIESDGGLVGSLEFSVPGPERYALTLR